MTKSKPFLRIVKGFIILIIFFAISLIILFYCRTSVTENIDNYEYQLPFEKGFKHRVVQGYGGLFSHRNIAALDFEMPIGTPICAARGGIIYSYRDGNDVGGLLTERKANYIIIKHDDGSFGCYWHLKKKGVLIKKGYVLKGQQIGLSGATGFVLRPHLHFSVKRILNYKMNSFVKTKFQTSKGLLFLEMGNSYKRP